MLYSRTYTVIKTSIQNHFLSQPSSIKTPAFPLNFSYNFCMGKPKEIDIGFKIDESRIWELDVPVEEIPISELGNNLDIPYLEKEGTNDWNLSINELMKNFDKEKTHAKKVKQADLNYPIEIYFHKGQWILLDGVHRLAKAVLEGQGEIKVRRITKEMLGNL